MPTPDPHRLVLVRRLERVLLAFFLLALLFLCVSFVATPSIYTNTLLLKAFPTDRHPLPATLFLVSIALWIAVVMVGVVRHWRLFWLLLVAFGSMLLEIPAPILQLTGVLLRLFPLWYGLCRMGASLMAVVMAVWMLQIYLHHGVWAMGNRPKARQDTSRSENQLRDHEGPADACER